MKFLLELMSCYGGSHPRTSLVKEETRSLVGCNVPAPRQTNNCVRGFKRGRSGKGGSVEEWRPSLSSISEDIVVYEVGKGREQQVVAAAGRSPSDRNLKRKVTSTPKARPRISGLDTGRPSFQAMMPAFSPAPFVF